MKTIYSNHFNSCLNTKEAKLLIEQECEAFLKRNKLAKLHLEVTSEGVVSLHTSLFEILNLLSQEAISELKQLKYEIGSLCYRMGLKEIDFIIIDENMEMELQHRLHE